MEQVENDPAVIAAKKKQMALTADENKFVDENLADKKLDGSNSGMQAANVAKAVTDNSSGTNNYQKAGSGLMAYGAGTANPYAVAAGAALSTYGSVKSQAEAEEKQKYNEKVAKLNREQEALSAVSQLAQRFKSF
jgi:hypothetical protein